MWVHPLYPLLETGELDGLVARCMARQSGEATNPFQGQELSIFYLVMALGAMNRSNTVKQLRLGCPTATPSDRLVSAYLYSEASKHLTNSLEHKQFRPSIAFIRIILLVCMYSSCGPIGSSQWQLAGLAMRVRSCSMFPPPFRSLYATSKVLPLNYGPMKLMH